MIVLGLFLAFFGNKFVNVVIYIATTIVVFALIVFLLFNWIMSKVKKDWIQWLFLALVFLGSNICGYFMVRLRRVGIAILAAFGGVMLGILITTTCSIHKPVWYWLIVVGLAVVLAVIAFFVERHVIMFITSFIGSYCIIRGISLYAGGFPNEAALEEQIKSGALNWHTFNKAFYGYFAGIVVLTLVSWYF